jgi:hypothetical protein
MTRHLIFGILIWGNTLSVFGQSCTQKLEEAMRAYYGGNLREVETLIDYTACAENLTKEQRVNALRIIVISNLFLKEQEKAEDAMLKLLKVNPEYKLTDVDLPEFEKLLSSFKRNPVFSLGLFGGLNHSGFVVTEQYSLGEIISPPNYKSITGFQVGISGFYLINKNIWLHSSLFAQKRSYLIEEKFREILGSDTLMIQSTEKQLHFQFPIAIRYVFGHWNKNYRPYIEGGAQFGYLMNAKSQLVVSNLTTGQPPRVNFEYELNNNRNRINKQLFIGVGILKKRGKNIVGIHAGYSIALESAVKAHSRFQYPELFSTFGYIDNEFKINSFLLSLTFNRIYYKPKLIKK